MYDVCSKSIKTKVVFTKTGMDNEWSINLLQIYPLRQQLFSFDNTIIIIAQSGEAVEYTDCFSAEG